MLPDRDHVTPNLIEVAGREYTNNHVPEEVTGREYIYNRVPELDWRKQTRKDAEMGDVLPELRTIPLGECKEPHGMAVDRRQNRLFVGCNNMELAILDSVSGAKIASFTVGAVEPTRLPSTPGGGSSSQPTEAGTEVSASSASI